MLVFQCFCGRWCAFVGGCVALVCEPLGDVGSGDGLYGVMAE